MRSITMVEMLHWQEVLQQQLADSHTPANVMRNQTLAQLRRRLVLTPAMLPIYWILVFNLTPASKLIIMLGQLPPIQHQELSALMRATLLIFLIPVSNLIRASRRLLHHINQRKWNRKTTIMAEMLPWLVGLGLQAMVLTRLRRRTVSTAALSLELQWTNNDTTLLLLVLRPQARYQLLGSTITTMKLPRVT